MGLFLSISGIIGKSKDEVETSLRKFVNNNSKKIKKKYSKNTNGNNFLLHVNNENVTIVYHNHFSEYEESSKFISEDLESLVFSLYIYNGDYWAYSLYQNGKLINEFTPIPTYWIEDITEEVLLHVKGDAELIANYIESLETGDIKNYLVRWDLDDLPEKAYPDDESEYGNCWQLTDFMNRIGLEYPIDKEGNSNGSIFTFE